MRIGRILCLLFLGLLSFLGNNSILYAQSKISGKIIAKDTRKPLAGATILCLANNKATSTDSLGNFSINVKAGTHEVQIRAMGYKELRRSFTTGDTSLMIALEHESNTLEAISITHRGKYRNRGNKAVELIDLVVKHKNQNRLKGKDSLSFEQYDKLKFGMVNPKPIFKMGLSELNFFFDNVDTLQYPDKKLLTIFMEESNAKVYNQRNPAKYKKQIYSQKKTEFDKRYINNHNIQSYLNYVFQPIDVYDESIFILNKQFLSPIADNGKHFYKYYIVDTIFNKEGYFIQLAFEPRNTTDLLFKGKLQVSMDGSYAVKQAFLSIDKQANLNWVNQGDLRFHYRKNEEGVMLLDTAHAFISFGTKRGDAVFADRLSVHTDYELPAEIPSGTFQGAPVEILASAEQTPPKRAVDLNPFEQATYSNIEQLNHKGSFKTLLAVGYLIAQGYHNLGKFELGPLEYLYSRNNIEGNRFRIGGRSTQELTDKAYVEAYAAYGTDDQRWKYYVSTAVSLNGKSVVTFPAHYLEATVQNDIMEPGQNLSFLKGDSFFRSIRKNRPTKWFDMQGYQLQHVIEFGNHISLTTGFTHQDRHTVGDLLLINSGNPDELLTQITTNEAHVDLRWAPNEKFYYRNLTRRSIIERYPVFNVKYTKSIDGFWGSSYAYDKLAVAASKRLFLNQLGFMDMKLSGGKIWGTLPYTLLELPNVKQPDDRHTIDFSMMNPMEFAADEYIKFSVFHQMQGFLFNKIPLLKRLNLREIWGANMFYGRMNEKNNPYLSDKVVEFDKNADGEVLTYVLNDKAPYWEGSVGIDNILNCLRVEYVKRLTYEQLPRVDQDRFRVSININF